MVHKESFIQGLSDILVLHRVISSEQARDFQEVFKQSPHEDYDYFLLEEGVVTTDEMLEALSKYYNVPFFDAGDYFFRTMLLHDFPKDFLMRNAVIPVEVENLSMLTVVAADPSQEGLESALREYVSYDIVFLVGIKSDIWDAVEEYYDTSVTEVIDGDDSNPQEPQEKVVDRIMLEDDASVEIIGLDDVEAAELDDESEEDEGY